MAKSESFYTFIPGFFRVLLRLLSDQNYLIKGGQALHFHLENTDIIHDVRFSRDIDVAFASATAPFDTKTFHHQLIESYNGTETEEYVIKARTVQLERLPKDKHLYFGQKLSFAVRRKKGPSGNVYFREIGGVYVRIDFTFNELVTEKWLTINNDMRLAAVPLIIAEKYRALCSQIEGAVPHVIPTPRPKDFYDLFLIYNRVYQKTVDHEQALDIREAIHKSFAVKNIDPKLLDELENEEVKRFHGRVFEEQVLQTLPRESRYKDVPFDQLFSDTLEFCDKVK